MKAAEGVHRQQRQHLEQVVLDHVPDRADALVERGARRDVEVLGHRDLDLADVVAVPDRLEERVGEAEEEDVLDGRLAEEVIDPEDALLREDAQQRAVELAGRSEVAPERLFDDDAAALGEAGVTDVVDDGREQARAESPGSARAVHSPRARRAGWRTCAGRRSASDVADQSAEPLPGLGVEAVAASLDALARTLAQLLEVPVLARDADDRDVEITRLDHPLQRREDLLESEVAGGAEEDERVRAFGTAHPAPPAPPASGARRSPARPGARHDRRTARASPTAGGGRGVLAARAEAREQRRRQDRRGHAVSIAASAVQRPSPESDTSPEKPSSDGSSCRAAAARSSSQRARPCRGARPRRPSRRRSRSGSARGRSSAPSRRRSRGAATGVRVAQQVETLGVASMRPYSMPLWTIFTKCHCPKGRSAASPAPRARASLATGRARRGVDARRERAQQRLDGAIASGAARHQPVAVLEPPDAAAHAAVDVVDPAARELV